MRAALWVRLAVEIACVPLAALLVTGFLTGLPSGSELRSDQLELNLIVLKRLQPEALPRDALYGSRVIDLYTPSFIAVQAAVARMVGGAPATALRVLVWPFGVLFLVGHYVLFRSVTGSPAAAGLAAIAALPVRNAPGGDYWGFDGLAAVQPRAVLNALTPVLLLLFLRWRDRRGFPLYFGVLGLLFNLHPVSALHMAQVTGVGHVWLARSRRRAAAQVLAGIVLFVVAAFPLAGLIMMGRSHGVEPAGYAQLREAVAYRFPYALYPMDAQTVVSLAIHAALLAGVGAWLLRRGDPGDDRRNLLWLALIAVIVGLGGAAMLQGASSLADRPYIDILQMRATKLAYPALLAGLATVYARLLAQGSRQARLILVVLVGLSLVPPGLAIHGSPTVRQAVKRFLGLGVPERLASPAPAPAPEELWTWVQAHTARDKLFFTDSAEFRDRTLRSITGTFKDGGWFYLGGPRPFLEWYRYMRAIDGCRAARGRGCWFELGRRYGADYVIVDPGVDRAAPPAEEFAAGWSDGRWSVWRDRRR